MRKPLPYFWNFALIALLGAGLFALNQAKSLRAQTVAFQNSNSSCEQENVLCTSASPAPFSCRDAMSVACKNVTGGADFNGDGFFDCATANSFFPNTTGADLDVSVLINTGNTGPCTGGVVDQFNASADYELVYSDTTFGIDLGSIVVGDIGGGAFDDLAVPSGENTLNPLSNKMVTAFSVAGGGFGPPGAAPTSTAEADWNPTPNTVIGTRSIEGQRNAALLDCDGNGTLDAAVAGGDSSIDFYTLNVMLNDGSALQDVLPGDDFDTTIPFDNSSPNPIMNVAVADFDGAGGPDVAVAVSSNFFGPDTIAVCLNNGACGYTCTQEVDVNSLFAPQQDLRMSSIAAGDFDGDGNADVVITTPGLNGTAGNEVGIHFFMGDGTGNLATPGIHVPYQPTGRGIPFVLTTGFFNNDDADDVALSYEGGLGNSNVGVFVMDAARAVTTTTLAYSGTNPVVDRGGIDAVDLDNQGCDDIVSLASEEIDMGKFIEVQRHAYVFMNDIETMSAIAGADQVADLDTPVAISGAACTLSPADPGAVVNVSWTLAPAVGATLSGADTLTPTFTATEAGAYTLTLNCNTRCTGDTTDTKVVTVGAVPPVIPGDTQGGCLASLTPGAGLNASWFYAVFLLTPLAFFLRRFGRKGAIGLVVAATLLGAALPARALTTSFSVNTFEPTVDDSEYFTIYNSPTMLKRNFHVGFYLDYAHNPYEFGNANF
ncbi:MAG: FG-GAP repeat protein, partial [Deltaproteobacteria bacterium]|nr:FG-GAP repeat protein [Deltaproteobacteria bacterium]